MATSKSQKRSAGSGFEDYLASRKNQVGLLLAILVVVLHIAVGLGPYWAIAAAAAYGAGAVLTPAPKQKELEAPVMPTPVLLGNSLRETSDRLFKALPPAPIVRGAKELEANVGFVLGEWNRLEATPDHRQTMWNIVQVYYPQITETYLEGAAYRDPRAVAVMADSLATLSDAAGRIKQGILDDNLRAMDSQAQYLRSQLGALPGLDDHPAG